MVNTKEVVKCGLLGLFFQLIWLTGCTQPASVSAEEQTETHIHSQADTKPEAQSDNRTIAFPGAEGFGKFTTGGRGGQVVVVTNLNDEGEGSLRDAIRKKGPRTVVFAVSGYIDLKSPLDINNEDITIAGQSAPGDGITLRYYPVNIKADNVIIRYLRFRMGDTAGEEGDAASANRGKENIIIDHCSMSWGTDESASFYRNKNFTLQWSIIAESLNESVHAKGKHGYGGIWGGEGATFHHNLFASHNSRTPRFSGSSTTPNNPEELVDFRNNVIFNWGDNNVYGGEKGRYNMVNNYYKPGPATASSKKDRLVSPSKPYGQFYVAGNFIEGQPEISKNNWAGGVQCEHPDSVKAVSPFSAVAITEHTPAKAYELVLSQAGANYKRDAVDNRIIGYVRSGKPTAGKNGNGLIDSQNDVGGWPRLSPGTPMEDADMDGMPDAWERQQKLNPNDKADATAYSLNKQYTNIEVYLNSLVNKDTL